MPHPAELNYLESTTKQLLTNPSGDKWSLAYLKSSSSPSSSPSPSPPDQNSPTSPSTPLALQRQQPQQQVNELNSVFGSVLSPNDKWECIDCQKKFVREEVLYPHPDAKSDPKLGETFFCRKCFAKRFRKGDCKKCKCAVLSDAPFVIHGDLVWHSTCWTCSYCDSTSEPILDMASRPSCESCFDSLAHRQHAIPPSPHLQQSSFLASPKLPPAPVRWGAGRLSVSPSATPTRGFFDSPQSQSQSQSHREEEGGDREKKSSTRAWKEREKSPMAKSFDELKNRMREAGLESKAPLVVPKRISAGPAGRERTRTTSSSGPSSSGGGGGEDKEKKRPFSYTQSTRTPTQSSTPSTTTHVQGSSTKRATTPIGASSTTLKRPPLSLTSSPVTSVSSPRERTISHPPSSATPTSIPTPSRGLQFPLRPIPTPAPTATEHSTPLPSTSTFGVSIGRPHLKSNVSTPSPLKVVTSNSGSGSTPRPTVRERASSFQSQSSTPSAISTPIRPTRSPLRDQQGVVQWPTTTSSPITSSPLRSTPTPTTAANTPGSSTPKPLSVRERATSFQSASPTPVTSSTPTRPARRERPISLQFPSTTTSAFTSSPLRSTFSPSEKEKEKDKVATPTLPPAPTSSTPKAPLSVRERATSFQSSPIPTTTSGVGVRAPPLSVRERATSFQSTTSPSSTSTSSPRPRPRPISTIASRAKEKEQSLIQTQSQSPSVTPSPPPTPTSTLSPTSSMRRFISSNLLEKKEESKPKVWTPSERWSRKKEELEKLRPVGTSAGGGEKEKEKKGGEGGTGPLRQIQLPSTSTSSAPATRYPTTSNPISVSLRPLPTQNQDVEVKSLADSELCSGCSKDLGYGELIEVGETFFHKTCFVCTGCKQLLQAGKITKTGDGKCWHTKCAPPPLRTRTIITSLSEPPIPSESSPTESPEQREEEEEGDCFACQRPLGPGLSITLPRLGRSFHQDCLECGTCGKEFAAKDGERGFVEVKGQVYHPSCAPTSTLVAPTRSTTQPPLRLSTSRSTPPASASLRTFTSPSSTNFQPPRPTPSPVSSPSIFSTRTRPPANLGGLMVCAGCGTKASEKEIVLGPKGKRYHSKCLTCGSCGRGLDSEAKAGEGGLRCESCRGAEARRSRAISQNLSVSS